MRLNAKELIANARVTAPTLPPAAAKLMSDMADRLDVQYAALRESRKQVQQLVAERMTKPKMMAVGVMSQSKFEKLDNGNVRFIALWPRPGIHVCRKRPDDAVLVYARISNAGEGNE